MNTLVNLKTVKNKFFNNINNIIKNYQIYTMALPAMFLILLFSYFPMFGLLIAFKKFTFDKGIIGSDWANPIYNNFIFLFNSREAFSALVNTILLNSLFILGGAVSEVSLALLLNEISGKIFKKVVQSFTILPYFVSWIVVGVFAYNLLNYEHGTINTVLAKLNLGRIDWYSNASIWPAILLVVNRWKLTGYGCIIYLATLSGIDSSYYEAAEIDGASKLQQICHISIPMLKPTIIILVLLQIGRIMNADFGMFYALVGDNSQVFSTSDVVDTFVYRNLKILGDTGMASAASLIQSLGSFILIFLSNLFVRKIDNESALF
jgi:ABC-type polysaccharide transport system, permease component